MSSWRVEQGPNGLRLEPVVHRALSSRGFTWADLIARHLEHVRVYVLYFPSQWDLPVDKVATEAIATFGRLTGSTTSVNFWDPTDVEFGRALACFGLETHPGLVFATGLLVAGARPFGPNPNLYAVSLTDVAVLGDRERLAAAANAIHEVVARGDPDEIADYVRRQEVRGLLESVGRITGGVLDGLTRLKLKFGLPGGVTLGFG